MMLGFVIAEYRRGRGCGVRHLAKEIGIPQATLNRVENGHACDSDTLTKIIAWLLKK